MLHFGTISLLSFSDLAFLRSAVKSLHARKGRLLRGIELGPWLGRSTLTILAPDLPIGEPNPLATMIGDLAMRPGFMSNEQLLAILCEQGNRIGESYSRIELVSLIYRALCYKVDPKPRYFSRLWCVDTWGGIESEKNLYFKESLDGSAKHIFLSNIRKAGFEHVVDPVQGDSSALAFVDEKVDFVFIDADHEYESLVRDLFAVRHALNPSETFLCGHDYSQVERWPGVKMAVEDFIKHYTVDGNIWISRPEGIEFLLSLPDYTDFGLEVGEKQKLLNGRYSDPAYCAKFGVDTFGAS